MECLQNWDLVEVEVAQLKERSKVSKFTPTGVLVGANIAMYAFTSILGGKFVETNYLVLIQFGQVNSLVMHGWYWQLFSSMFVHANLLHLFGNMFFLIVFGLRAEELFSNTTYLILYFASGLFGNIFSLLWGPNSPPSVGASGAIFGLFGANVAYLGKFFGRSITSALIYSFYLLLISSGANVNILAHFGGLAAGLSIGYSLAKRRRLSFENSEL